MPRVGLIIEDELHEAINQEAEKTHILPSELMRMAMREYFASRGYELTQKIKLGGHRQGAGKKPRSKKETA